MRVSLSKTLLCFALLNLLFHALQQPCLLVNVSDLGQGSQILMQTGKSLCSTAQCPNSSFFDYVFLLHFLVTEMYPHQLCYIKTYETFKKHKMKMDVVCVADDLLKLGALPCS
jgi:hypothetical protein